MQNIAREISAALLDCCLGVIAAPHASHFQEAAALASD